jgi:hypothetical protein
MEGNYQGQTPTTWFCPVLNWVQSSNSGMETAQKGICLVAQPHHARTLTTVQIVFDFIMVEKHITVDELQHGTGTD